MNTETPSAIVHHPERGRFEMIVGGQSCHADYRLRDGVMLMTHTEVPRHLEGRGLAGQVVAAALDYARSEGLKVAPLCSYVRSYMQRHPETRDLIAS